MMEFCNLVLLSLILNQPLLLVSMEQNTEEMALVTSGTRLEEAMAFFSLPS